MTAARATQQVAGGLDVGVRRELVDQRVDHRGDRLGGSALSESVSKSACAVRTRSDAARVLVSSASAFSARARSCSISRSRRSFVAGASPERAPASAALRHSTMWEEYRPSQRKIAPRSPRSAAPYSARMSALYSAVNVRRLGRSARGPMPPSSTEESARVIVIGCYSLLALRQNGFLGCRFSPCAREGTQRMCLTSAQPDAQGIAAGERSLQT